VKEVVFKNPEAHRHRFYFIDVITEKRVLNPLKVFFLFKVSSNLNGGNLVYFKTEQFLVHSKTEWRFCPFKISFCPHKCTIYPTFTIIPTAVHLCIYGPILTVNISVYAFGVGHSFYGF
jgi:hypothetical protein